MSSTRSAPEQSLAFVGVTRFSVDPASIIEPQPENRPLAPLQAALYAPGRLQRRLALFRTFTLPSMVAAAGRSRKFHYVILISPKLPTYYQAMLWALCLRHRPWCHLRTIGPEERFSDVTRETIAALAGRDRVFNFRIDDDDAIRPEFVDRVIELSETTDNGGVVSFDLGYYVQRISQSMYFVHERDYPKIAIGLGVFSTGESPECIYAQGLHKRIPVETVTNVRDGPYWIRTLHAENDSGMRSKENLRVDLPELCARLAPTFGHLALERALLALSTTAGMGSDSGALRALYKIQ